MNCKPGDLAIVIKSAAGNEGKIVEVLSPLGEDPVIGRTRWCKGRGFCWLVRSSGLPISFKQGGFASEAPVPDAWLRPIRPADLDESTDTDIKKKVTE
jgi:hypothetical protein